MSDPPEWGDRVGQFVRLAGRCEVFERKPHVLASPHGYTRDHRTGGPDCSGMNAMAMSTPTDSHASISAMPGLLRALIGVLAVGAAFDLVLALQTGDTTSWIRMGLGIGCIVGLWRGSEGVRSVLRGLAGVGIVIGGVGLFQAVVLASRVPMSGLVATAVGASVLALGVCIFMFVVLGRHDVQAWLLRRSVGAV